MNNIHLSTETSQMNNLLPKFLQNEITDNNETWSLEKLKEDTIICDANENEETYNYHLDTQFNHEVLLI